MTNRIVNTVASIRSQLQTPTLSRKGVPVSFVDMNSEPHEDAPPPIPNMPDKIPDHIDPTPDEPNEDADDRSDDIREMELALAEIQNGYMRFYKIRERLRGR